MSIITVTPIGGQFVVEDGVGTKTVKFQQKQHTTTTFRTVKILEMGATVKCYFDHSQFGRYYFYGTIANNPDVWVEAYDISSPSIYPGKPLDSWFDVDIALDGIHRPLTQIPFSIQKEFAPGLSQLAQANYRIVSTPTPRTGSTPFLPEDFGELEVIGTISGELTGTVNLENGTFYNDVQRGIMINGGGSFELSSDQSKIVSTGLQIIYNSNTRTWTFDAYTSTNFACTGKSVIVE